MKGKTRNRDVQLLAALVMAVEAPLGSHTTAAPALPFPFPAHLREGSSFAWISLANIRSQAK